MSELERICKPHLRRSCASVCRLTDFSGLRLDTVTATPLSMPAVKAIPFCAVSVDVAAAMRAGVLCVSFRSRACCFDSCDTRFGVLFYAPAMSSSPRPWSPPLCEVCRSSFAFHSSSNRCLCILSSSVISGFRHAVDTPNVS